MPLSYNGDDAKIFLSVENYKIIFNSFKRIASGWLTRIGVIPSDTEITSANIIVRRVAIIAPIGNILAVMTITFVTMEITGR